jgi:hypothetical protein
VNQEVLDYILASCDHVARVWDISLLYRDVDTLAGDLLVVGHSLNWIRSRRSEIREHVGDGAIHSTSQRRLVFVNTRTVDFSTSTNLNAFRGYHWVRAYVQDFMAETVNAPGSMPVWRIPSQADWHNVSDAVEDATEFLRTHEGEVEFDFQGNRYKVPYGCDYCVMVGSVMPEQRARYSTSGLRTQPFWMGGDENMLARDAGAISLRSVQDAYASAMFSTSPAVPQHVIDQALVASAVADNATAAASPNAAITRQHAEQAMQRINEITNQRLADYVYGPSPTFERLRSRGRQAFDGGDVLRNPIQFALPDPIRVDPLDLPGVGNTGAPQWNFSEVARWPTAAPSARELDLQRRLDTVRECLSRGPNPIVFGTPEDARSAMEALNYPAAPVQDLDSYVYRYEFVNGQALKVNDKLSCGTILDAAARPVRKFRLVEE